eukprot:TRINITY_DN3845_c2_g1_i3.p1 TRINITY_DN3845_c2_g1~~TRINITY_DN3845_c2_g1_i3.p1  ORF type:complete len:191 (+),score=27.36 TRINITY_DN3845_c2_g1_i3:77-649(+)
MEVVVESPACCWLANIAALNGGESLLFGVVAGGYSKCVAGREINHHRKIGSIAYKERKEAGQRSRRGSESGTGNQFWQSTLNQTVACAASGGSSRLEATMKQNSDSPLGAAVHNPDQNISDNASTGSLESPEIIPVATPVSRRLTGRSMSDRRRELTKLGNDLLDAGVIEESPPTPTLNDAEQSPPFVGL